MLDDFVQLRGTEFGTAVKELNWFSLTGWKQRQNLDTRRRLIKSTQAVYL